MSLYYEDLKSPQTTIQQFSTNILEWDCEKVSRWISYLGLAKYSSGFRGMLYYSIIIFIILLLFY